MEKIDNNQAVVHVSLPNHWGASGETIAARSLGGDAWQLLAAPVYAYDLNCGDVVRAVAERPGFVPEVRDVVRRSGHSTLRLFFFELVPVARRLTMIAQLNAPWDSVRDRYFVLDVPPTADRAAIRRTLDGWEAEGWIEYETCEAKLPGTFDDVPVEPD